MASVGAAPYNRIRTSLFTQVVTCRFDNIAGLYTLKPEGGAQPDLKCHPGQYYNKEDDKVLWYTT